MSDHNQLVTAVFTFIVLMMPVAGVLLLLILAHTVGGSLKAGSHSQEIPSTQSHAKRTSPSADHSGTTENPNITPFNAA